MVACGLVTSDAAPRQRDGLAWIDDAGDPRFGYWVQCGSDISNREFTTIEVTEDGEVIWEIAAPAADAVATSTVMAQVPAGFEVAVERPDSIVEVSSVDFDGRVGVRVVTRAGNEYFGAVSLEGAHSLGDDRAIWGGKRLARDQVTCDGSPEAGTSGGIES